MNNPNGVVPGFADRPSSATCSGQDGPDPDPTGVGPSPSKQDMKTLTVSGDRPSQPPGRSDDDRRHIRHQRHPDGRVRPRRVGRRHRLRRVDPCPARPRVRRHRRGQPASPPDRRRRQPGGPAGDHLRPDDPGRPLLRRRGHLQRRHREPTGAGARLHRGWMPDEGESIQQLLESEVFANSLVPAALRPVPFTNPDGSEGVDLYLDRECSPRRSPPTSTPRRPR
jgi:hypothetical protein